MRRIDITGQRFGRLTAQIFLGGKVSHWLCLCDCGNQTTVASGDLRKKIGKATTSCGCRRVEICRRNGKKPHKILHGHTVGGRETPEYALWQKAKQRSKERDIPFSITIHDIHIPTHCPVLGIPLVSHRGEQRKYWSDDSPTIDRIIPDSGYIPSNIWVISYRANKIKSDASLTELYQIIDAMKRVMGYA